MLLLSIAGTAKRTKLNTTTIFSVPPWIALLACHWPFAGRQKTIKTFEQNVAPADSRDSQEDKIKHDDIFSGPPWIAFLARHWPFASRKKKIKTFKQNVAPANSRDSQEDKIKHDNNFFSAPLDRPLGLSLALRWSQKDNKNVQAKCCSCQ